MCSDPGINDIKKGIGAQRQAFSIFIAVFLFILQWLRIAFQHNYERRVKDMDQKRPLILLSNDDGVDAEGLIRLTETLRELGNVVVFAPDGPRSGMSRAITAERPIKCKLLGEEEGL